MLIVFIFVTIIKLKLKFCFGQNIYCSFRTDKCKAKDTFDVTLIVTRIILNLGWLLQWIKSIENQNIQRPYLSCKKLKGNRKETQIAPEVLKKHKSKKGPRNQKILDQHPYFVLFLLHIPQSDLPSPQKIKGTKIKRLLRGGF